MVFFFVSLQPTSFDLSYLECLSMLDSQSSRKETNVFNYILLSEQRQSALQLATQASCTYTILDRIKWNSKPPSPQIKDEAALKPKRAIFPSLIFFSFWGGGGGGTNFPFVLFKIVTFTSLKAILTTPTFFLRMGLITVPL